MSLFDKNFKNKILTSFDANEFKELISRFEDKIPLERELNLLTTKFYGLDFNVLWSDLDSNKEKIELIRDIDTIVNDDNLSNEYKYLRNAFNNQIFYSFADKIQYYIYYFPYKWKHITYNKRKVWKLLNYDIDKILEIIKDEEISTLVHTIMNSKDYKEAERNLFSIQKEFGDDFKKLKSKKNNICNIIKFDILNRKIQAFVRHEKGHNDIMFKEFYQKLSDDEKLKEIQQLTVEYLLVIYLMKK